MNSQTKADQRMEIDPSNWQICFLFRALAYKFLFRLSQIAVCLLPGLDGCRALKFLVEMSDCLNYT